MNILVVNDDGISTNGIARLAQMATQLGKVYVVAPAGQCTAMSMRVTAFESIAISEYDFPIKGVEAAYSVGGTPVDCVAAAIRSILPQRPDIVFSGINEGYNAGFDIAYSGTIGAAMEALMNGIPAIAFSAEEKGRFDICDKYILDIAKELIIVPIAKNELWNVNFPGCGMEGFKGIMRQRSVAKSCYYNNRYIKTQADRGFMLKPKADIITLAQADKGSDIEALLNGYISIGKVKNMLI